MEKINYKKKLQHLYKPSAKEVEIVEVPQMNYLMIDGDGGPNHPTFQNAIEVLFPLSYTLKFMIKKSDIGIDYGVLPLEGLWWADDMSSFIKDKKDDWKWTLMIMQPELITNEMVVEAVNQVRVKKNPTSLPLVRFESINEGKVAQIMHIGPFSEEGPTVQKLHSFIKDSGKKIIGKHHEVYLSDIRRAAPEKWKTIIRQPMS
tara:strand:+ start:147 stop:755 length:609 start_codon:yes stop_codon:yes gene_type:complete